MNELFEEVSNELVMMYDCTFKKRRDLKVGDLLMGDDSQPCKILEIKLILEKENYRVIPVKGDSFIVGQSHSLSVNMSGARVLNTNKNTGIININWFDKKDLCFHKKIFNPIKYENFSEKAYEAAEDHLNSLDIKKRLTMTIGEYIKSVHTVKHCTKLYRVPLDFPSVDIPFDPYVLGLWLGDGTQRDPNITSVDTEIIDYITEYFKQFNLVVKRIGEGIAFGITSGTELGPQGRNPFRNFLREYGLNDEKHIPINYLMNSKENRLRLLAGLLDTDGSLEQNCYDFVQKREALLEQFLFLCKSLGFACYKKETQKTCTNSPTKATGTYYRCCVSGEGLEEIPVLLPRKKANKREQVKDALVTGFTLEKLGSFLNYRLITDKPRYLMSDFTVRRSYKIIK